MKPFQTIFGNAETRGDSPLADLPVIFPNGTPSRATEFVVRDTPGVQSRSEYAAQWDVLGQILGQSRYAGTYSPREAYGLSPWMQPAIHAFAGTVAARTFRVFNGKKPLDEHWLIDLIARPNATLRTSEFELLYFSAALWRYAGEVFWHLEYGNDPKKPGQRRNLKARPTGVWMWHREAVEADIDPSTREFRGWIINWNGLRTFVDRFDMVHFPLFDPTQHNPMGPSRGTSLWNAKRLAITNEIKAQKWSADYWSRGIAPSVAFTNKNGDGLIDEELFLDKLKAKLAGKNGEPIVLTGDWLIQQLEATQRDAQFTEGMDQNRKAILAGNTPPIVLGDNEANYANANAQIKAWLTFDVIPAMTFFCSRIDTAFLYEEPRLWTELSTDDIDELQEGKGARIDRYLALVNARHSPKVAAAMTGLDVDPTMPGHDKVFLSFSQIPYDYAVEGQSVSVSKPDAPEAIAPTTTPSAEAVATPTVDQPVRFVRVLVDEVRPTTATRAAEDSDPILQLLLKITRTDTGRLKSKSATFQLQSLEVGTKQIADSLGSTAIQGIDNPRVAAFLKERGNLITSVPDGVAQRIHKKTVALIDKGTSPEDIGTILRKDFSDLSSYKSRQIARQEVGSGLNAGRFIQMEEEGIESREWLSSRDANVRESHERIDGEVVGIDEKYSNGLRWPQDPEGSNEEVQGCRCTELPVIGGARSTRCAIHLRAAAALEIAAAAKNGEQIDERTGQWRAIARAKSVRAIERQMASTVGGIINGWRSEILKALAEMGVVK